MHRIAFVGCPGAGKTTLACEAAERLGVRHVELDALFHRAGWTPMPDSDFRRAIAETLDVAEVESGGWTVDGNYNRASDGLAQRRASTIVWVDPPKAVVINRIVRRTLRRVLTRQELWNGNREPWSNLWSPDPEKNVIVWSWTRFDHYRSTYATLASSAEWAHARVVHARTRSDAAAFLAGLT